MDETLIERILSGKSLNHHGEYTPSKKHPSENKKKYIASKSLCPFLNLVLWTIKNTIIHNIHNTMVILITVHKKLPRDELVN